MTGHVKSQLKSSQGPDLVPGIPRASSLYGPIDLQLTNPASFCSSLRRLLTFRKSIQVETSKFEQFIELQFLESKSKSGSDKPSFPLSSLFAPLYRLGIGGKLFVPLLNFSNAMSPPFKIKMPQYLSNHFISLESTEANQVLLDYTPMTKSFTTTASSTSSLIVSNLGGWSAALFIFEPTGWILEQDHQDD